MAIETKEALDKKIVEQDGEIAALKAKALESEKLRADMDAVKAEAKELREKIAEVTSKNWVEKFSTQNTKEETLSNMGHYIKAMVNGDREGLEKYGKSGTQLSANEEKDFGRGEYKTQKSPTLGTPLYSDATTGSYLVPVEYAAEILYVAKQASQLMGQVREVPMRGITKYFPIQNATASVSWNTAQSSAKSETNPTFDQVTLTSKTGAMWSAIVDELDEDSLVSLAAYYRDIFGEAFGYEFDYQAGGQSTTNFTGMLAGADNVQRLAGQAFDDLTFDDLYDTIAQLTTENKRTGAKWIMHCTVFDVLRKLRDANGNYMYQKPEGTQPGSLCGYPYILSDGMPALSASAKDTKFIVFGNPKHMLWGNRVGMEFKTFDNTIYRMKEDMIYFRGRVRWAFTVGITGAFAVVATAA